RQRSAVFALTRNVPLAVVGQFKSLTTMRRMTTPAPKTCGFIACVGPLGGGKVIDLLGTVTLPSRADRPRRSGFWAWSTMDLSREIASPHVHSPRVYRP